MWRMSWRSGTVALLALMMTGVSTAAVEVGFGKADLTPRVGDGAAPVYIAGYGQNRKATGVHDPLWARAVVFREGDRKIAMVSVDLVGVQLPLTRKIRARLTDYAYVLISSTHNHEGPDVIGLWGPDQRHTGVDPAYLELVESKVVESVRAAEARLARVEATYGAASDESLVHDSRLPIVKDGVARVVRFQGADGKPVGLLVQWNCHPEDLGSRNTLLTADYPYYTIKALESRYGCPVAYFSGAVGGLMTGPERRFLKPDGTFFRGGEFEFAEIHGVAVADLVSKALEKAEAVGLSPFAVSARTVGLPLFNPGYRQLRALGVLNRAAFEWHGNSHDLGTKVADRQAEGPIALESEVCYVKLGDLHVAGIPGELYPELVYGQYQEPVEPNADFPTAPKEPAVMKTLPGPKTLLFGLANDEVGYIIPKRQWDWDGPFAYGRKDRQYGEVNSVGPEVAPILMKALVDAVAGAASR